MYKLLENFFVTSILGHFTNFKALILAVSINIRSREYFKCGEKL